MGRGAGKGRAGSTRAWRALRACAARVVARLRDLGPYLRDLGPYAVIVLLVPGGTLIALLMWLYQRQNATQAHPPGFEHYSSRLRVPPRGQFRAAVSYAPSRGVALR